MNEQPDDLFEGLSAEQIEMYQAYMASHPDKEIAPEDREDFTEKTQALEKALVSFENDFDLQALLAISNLTAEEAPRHPIREPARLALIPIVADLRFLKNESNIPKDLYDKLHERYRYLARAVGMINNNMVDHTR